MLWSCILQTGCLLVSLGFCLIALARCLTGVPYVEQLTLGLAFLIMARLEDISRRLNE